jgi:RNA polymerase sigma-70 factor (ECF subfamily)
MWFSRKSAPSSCTDEELAERYRREGDDVCLAELYERYAHLVFLACMKYLRDEAESEDMAMSIFEKLITDLRRYEIRRFRYWLHAVIKSQCLLHLEQGKKRQAREAVFHEEIGGFVENDAPGHPDAVPEKEAALLRLEEAIALLRTEQRTCVELFFLQRKSYQEVSDLTGYSLKQVKSYIQNGKRNLQKQLQGLDGEAIYFGQDEE